MQHVVCKVNKVIKWTKVSEKYNICLQNVVEWKNSDFNF